MHRFTSNMFPVGWPSVAVAAISKIEGSTVFLEDLSSSPSNRKINLELYLKNDESRGFV